MSIESKLQAIRVEVELIKESQDKILKHREELNKYSPYNIGDTLKGDIPAFFNKEFIVDKLSLICDSEQIPKFFSASGFVKKSNNELSKNRTGCSVEIKYNQGK
jgi:hypothetical protein